MSKERKKQGRPMKYPFDQLDVGDSFILDDEPYSLKLARKVSASAASYQRRTGAKFLVKKSSHVDEFENYFVVVIRVR